MARQWPKCLWLMVVLAMMACSASAGTVTLTGKTSGATVAAATIAGYTVTSSLAAIQYSIIQVKVDITLSAAATVLLSLNYPTDTVVPNMNLGIKRDLLASVACTVTSVVMTFDSSSTTAATTACSGTVQPSASLVGSQKWSVPDTSGTIPTGGTTANRWILLVTSTGGTHLLNSWSIVFTTQCTTLVPNSVNLGTSTSSGATQTLACNSGFSATSTAMTCAITGYTPVACINGGGAVMTWGLNSNPTVPQTSQLVNFNVLGRASVAPTAVLYDPNIGYLWLPNSVFATRAALGDLCTLVLSNAGVVYQWGYCGTPVGLTSATTTTVSAQIVAMPSGAPATMIWATHFTYAALTPGNQLVMWGVLTATTGPTGGVPAAAQDKFCGFTYQASPTAVTGLPGSLIQSVALAINRVAIVTFAGEVYAWGCNAYYSLGSTYVGSSVTSTSALVVTSPTKVSSTSLPTTARFIVMSEYQTAVRTSDNQLYYWGVAASAYNWAISTAVAGVTVPAPTAGTAIAVSNYISPTTRDSSRTYYQLVANRWTLAGLTSTGTVYTWGYTAYPGNQGAAPAAPIASFYGVLGRTVTGGAGYDDAVGLVDFGTTSRTISLIAIGGTFGLALDTSGNVVQWGSLLTDSVADGTTLWQWSTGSPTVNQLTLPTGDNVGWITAGRDTAAALDARNGASGCPSVGSMMTSQDVGFIPSMTDATRGKLCAGITIVSICGATNWVNSFLNVPFLTTPYSLTMPSFSNGVTISITNFNKVTYMVASTYTPTGASIAAVGITPLPGRLLLFLFQIEQMNLDSSMASSNPLVLTVVCNNLAVVYVYRAEYRSGLPLSGSEGGISNSGTTYTLSLSHTSAVAGYNAYDSGDGSNEALLGLLGLIALPVICAIGLYAWLWYRYTHTEAVVEAANPVAPVFMMEPQPIVAPSPAYIPAAYPAAPAYYV